MFDGSVRPDFERSCSASTRLAHPRLPTRAALMTGCNHDSIGFGVVTQESTGYPGYDSLRAMGVPERASAADWNLLSDIASSTRLPDAVPRLASSTP